jgi:hypothetical protein
VEGETIGGTPFSCRERISVAVSANRAAYEAVEPEVEDSLKRIHTKRVLDTAQEDIQSGSPERVARGTRRLRSATKRLDEMGQHELASITRRVVANLDAGKADADSGDLKALRQQTKRV